MKTSMKPSRSLITVGLMLAGALNVLAGNVKIITDPGDVKVIANPSVKTDSISTSELRSVFLLERKALRDGSRVEPVMEKSDATRLAFLKQYLNRDSEEIQTYYQGLVFTGKASMPKQLNSDTEVVAYVARSKGAVGYVSSAASTEAVNVLVVTSEGRKEERTLLARVEPQYPKTLAILQIGGTVRLELTISPKGSVENVVVLGGNPILAEAAVKAVRQWVYSVGPTRTTIQVSVPFEVPH